MIYGMIVSMKTNRITITIPHYLFELLEGYVASGDVSKYISSALEEKLLRTKTLTKSPVTAFFGLSRKLPELTPEEVIDNLQKGRK